MQRTILHSSVQLYYCLQEDDFWGKLLIVLDYIIEIHEFKWFHFCNRCNDFHFFLVDPFVCTPSCMNKRIDVLELCPCESRFEILCYNYCSWHTASVYLATVVVPTWCVENMIKCIAIVERTWTKYFKSRWRRVTKVFAMKSLLKKECYTTLPNPFIQRFLFQMSRSLHYLLKKKIPTGKLERTMKIVTS